MATLTQDPPPPPPGVLMFDSPETSDIDQIDVHDLDAKHALGVAEPRVDADADCLARGSRGVVGPLQLRTVVSVQRP